MPTAIRPLTSLAVAIVGAGALAIPPAYMPPHSLAQVSPTVQLAATTDILGPDQSTLDGSHAAFYNLLPVMKTLGLVTISPTAQELVDFSTSSLSGVLLGLAGPLAGPAVLLTANLQSIAADVAAGDVGGALATLAGTPAALVNAFLYGGVHLDLTSLVATAGPALGLQFPNGVKLGIAFGGLLSPAGSVFNALDFNFSLELGSLPLGTIGLATGTGPGAISSLAALVGTAAEAVTGALNDVATAISEIPRSVVNTVTALATPGAGLPALTARKAAADTAAPATIQLRDKTTRDSVKAVPNAARSTGGKHRATSGGPAGDQVSAASASADTAPAAKAGPAGQAKHTKTAQHAAA
ncbi:hypothetical protein [Mycolicibacterium komossense]|uniref:PE-PGRS family protein n=1 Tax=Mycolicibacterium komossense TaxID=1779 RepID=A0ABT3CDK3_9MYCO|nr:hypothetical protein [Mycolicibacterium komossense]MCV7227558.1 hypothetical protein [Mycolicibacterium komossense]